MKKRCGNCRFYVGPIRLYSRLSNGKYGLCDKYDLKCSLDCGKNCKNWKGIKYDRNKHK